MRSMLPSTRRPSATTGGSASKLESSSTSCATARVASRARAHRDPDVGVLQRERVVHAVAGHRHRVAVAPAAPCTIARFCCGVTRPNTECCSTTPPSSSPSSGSSRASNGLVGPSQAQAAPRSRPRCAGRRPRSPSPSRPARRSSGACRRRRDAGGRPSTTIATGVERRGEPLARRALSRVRQQDHAVPLLGLGVDRREHVVVARRGPRGARRARRGARRPRRRTRSRSTCAPTRTGPRRPRASPPGRPG